ncbi:MAG: flagellin lysine-N-methylase [Acutalibacteraceae bacterium]
MKSVFPDYYNDFRCIKSKCKHNCCIGWEIDIDKQTADFYQSVSGEFGERLAKSIDYNGEPHFILGKDERCPFLNENNLCDIILTLGENRLCSICNDHPRFKNQLPDRVEIGLGLSCEAAAALILGNKTQVKLLSEGELHTTDEIIRLRDDVIICLQNRKKNIAERVEEMLKLCGAKFLQKSIGEWADFLLSLERLDEKWTEVLNQLKENWETAQYSQFDEYMSSRESEYEQLLIYFIYRHFANAPSVENARTRACFAVFGYIIIRAIGAVIFTETGEFCFESQVETARLFSSEIEYSEDNFYTLLEVL